jgi:hypothetical protein
VEGFDSQTPTKRKQYWMATVIRGPQFKTKHRGTRWAGALLAVALLAALPLQVSEARPASAQIGVSATVLPRCQEWRAATEGFRVDATRSCAPGSATVVRRAEDLSVRCAPGACPRMIRQADRAIGADVLVVVF